MKLKFKTEKPIESTEVKTDYVCLNGKTLSEQTINDYAQFIPKWNEREEVRDDCYLVSCVQPQNHEHNDDPALGGEPSMIISKGNNHNVVVHCRNYSCPDSVILQYFLSRLIGEEVPMFVKQAPKRELTAEEERRIMEQKNTDRMNKKYNKSLSRWVEANRRSR
jgi:hypothetical protein